MILRSLKSLVALLFLAVSANAQIAVSLRVAKVQHLAGEPVLTTVTITNHAGRDLVFASDGRFQWLHFDVKTAKGAEVNAKGSTLFGAMKIKAGETLARTIDLSEHFLLSEAGNFSVSAMVHMPGNTDEGAGTNRVFFTQIPGRASWTQKVGMPGGSGNTREFRIITFTGDSKTQLYTQIVDGRTGQFVRTFLLGDMLTIRKPLCTVDRNQRMHVMFLATPTMWVHSVINTDGKVLSRQVHQRASSGDPQLLTFPDGSVRVSNSIPYDEKGATQQKSKVRKASDRPPGTF